MTSKELSETLTKVFINASENPCLCYKRVYSYHQDGLISEESWREYCLACLIFLQKTLDK